MAGSRPRFFKKTLTLRKIDNISKEQARSYFVRSRAEWMDKGEKYSKYFAGLEHSRQSNNSISMLTTNCGNNATGDSSILKEKVDFYKIIQLRMESTHILTK